MAPRLRPATTLLVLLAISFGFQLVAILSVPVTRSIYLSSYQGYEFGVFGLCSNSTCTGIQIGYSSDDIADLSGFTLPSNARHSVSKLLIVHPISTGFTLILLLCSIVLHWHGPSSSLKFLFFLLLWTIPSFLLCLLSFLVDILLFVPHLAWGGWIVLAATVLIAISSVLLCIMRRTVSSRKSTKVGRSNTVGDDYYQLEPLNYGYGTVDAGSDVKESAKDNESENNDESVPFVHDGNSTAHFDDSIQQTRTNEDLNFYPSTTLYDTMRGSNNPSAHSGRYGQANSPIPPPNTSYRGGYDPYINPVLPYEDEYSSNTPTAPYPTEIPTADVSGIKDGFTNSNAPYPTDDPLGLSSSKLLPGSPVKPLGPRPMPNSRPETPLLSSDLQFNNEDRNVLDNGEINLDEMESIVSGPNVERNPTFRTKIEQTLNALQPDILSTDSFSNTNEDLPITKPAATTGREIGQISFDEDTTGDFESSQDLTNDEVNQQSTYSFENDQADDLFSPSTIKQNSPEKTLIEPEADEASSTYSSHIPSVIDSATRTPTDPSFPKETSGSISARYSSNILSIPEGSAVQNVPTPSETSTSEYPFPDPLERRATPAPSFTNESTLSSNFTSVSLRGVNPMYFENNPQEHREHLQRQIEQQLNPAVPHRITQPHIPRSSDALIDSNPDFMIDSKFGKGRKPRR